MKELISVAEAQARLTALAQPSPAIRCPLSQAAGRVLREDILADRPLPPFDRVMMDGFALRYKAIADAVRKFRVVGQCLAGEPAGSLPDEPDAALEIMTGAPLPDGADVVIPYEDTDSADDNMTIRADAEIDAGQFIHRLGSDFASQSKLVPAGKRLRPAEMGVAASCGYAELLVSPRPRIAVASTGDELVAVEAQPMPHQIRASNAVAIEAALALAHYHVGELAHFPDDEITGAGMLREVVLRNDVVVLAGAVSKGQRDWLPEALDALGACIFHGVRQRPGKPMGVWRCGGCTVFALPGNPVSALVGLHRFVLPFLKMRDGLQVPAPMQVILNEPVAFAPPLTWFLPVVLFPDGNAIPCPVNNSGDYARLVDTDGFLELAAERSEWTAGQAAPFYPWSQ